MKIVTNNQPRAMVFGYELTEKQRAEFDYLDDIDVEDFIKYQGMIFHIGDFLRLSDDSEEAKQGWHGVYPLNAFCGVLVKMLDNEKVVIGKALC